VAGKAADQYFDYTPPVEGLVEISGQDVFDLFDAGTNKKSTVRVQRFRSRMNSPTYALTLR
jgi:hypothetical protein